MAAVTSEQLTTSPIYTTNVLWHSGCHVNRTIVNPPLTMVTMVTTVTKGEITTVKCSNVVPILSEHFTVVHPQHGLSTIGNQFLRSRPNNYTTLAFDHGYYGDNQC